MRSLRMVAREDEEIPSLQGRRGDPQSGGQLPVGGDMVLVFDKVKISDEIFAGGSGIGEFHTFPPLQH